MWYMFGHSGRRTCCVFCPQRNADSSVGDISNEPIRLCVMLLVLARASTGKLYVCRVCHIRDRCCTWHWLRSRTIAHQRRFETSLIHQRRRKTHRFVIILHLYACMGQLIEFKKKYTTHIKLVFLALVQSFRTHNNLRR